MPTGKVKWYDSGEGVGFLICDDGSDVSVQAAGLTLRPGQRVEFDLAEGGARAAVRVRILEQPPTVTTRPYQPSAMAPAPVPVVLKRPTVVRVVEAPTQRHEMIGDETRTFDNTKSSSTAVETIKVSHTARVSVSIDLRKTRTLSGNASAGFADMASARAGLGNELMRHYSRRMDEDLTHEQQTQINIPAHTNVEVIFHWFRILATGMLTLSERARPADAVAEAQFEITVGLGFNKETHDIR